MLIWPKSFRLPNTSTVPALNMRLEIVATSTSRQAAWGSTSEDFNICEMERVMAATPSRIAAKIAAKMRADLISVGFDCAGIRLCSLRMNHQYASESIDMAAN